MSFLNIWVDYESVKEAVKTCLKKLRELKLGELFTNCYD